MANYLNNLKFWAITICCLIVLALSSYILTYYYLKNNKIHHYEKQINKIADYTDYFAFHLDETKRDFLDELAAAPADMAEDGEGYGGGLVYDKRNDTIFEKYGTFNREIKKLIDFWKRFQKKPDFQSDIRTFQNSILYYVNEINTMDSINASITKLVEMMIFASKSDILSVENKKKIEQQLSITMKSLKNYDDFSHNVIRPHTEEVQYRLKAIQNDIGILTTNQLIKKINKAFDPIESLKNDSRFHYHINALLTCFVGFEEIGFELVY